MSHKSNQGLQLDHKTQKIRADCFNCFNIPVDFINYNDWFSFFVSTIICDHSKITEFYSFSIIIMYTMYTSNQLTAQSFVTLNNKLC